MCFGAITGMTLYIQGTTLQNINPPNAHLIAQPASLTFNKGNYSVSNMLLQNETISLDRTTASTLSLGFYLSNIANGSTVITHGYTGAVSMGFQTVADYGKPSPTFGPNPTNFGQITDAYGQLDIFVESGQYIVRGQTVYIPDNFVNAGKITSSAIGGATLNIILNNPGVRATNDDSYIASHGTIAVNGLGAFTNEATILASSGGTFSTALTGANGGVTNTGSIEAFSGSKINLNYNSFVNRGLVEVGLGSSATLTGATTINNGVIDTDGGVVTINGAVKQIGYGSPNGQIIAHNGGNIVLNGGITDGNVTLDNAILSFGGLPKMGFLGTAGSNGFASTLTLAGASDQINFGHHTIGEVLSRGHLVVYELASAITPLTLIADIKLANPTAYTAADFTVTHGTVIQYIHH
jgi:hypothetical protein